MSDLRRKLELRIDPEQGPTLDLDDWNHRDYIEDVLVEHFDIDYEYLIEDEKSGKCTLYFCESAELADIKNAIAAINRRHASSADLYETI
ncbi:hypothetical protein L2750_23160 [Shewanella submarina]|uniref:Uncharacterized protein n=1 Tax=Shewanella submarina TaxID=2016376 RepID=A0ABV7GGK7_9GAMM|nr:hypothetical protein [Shewanella submarina]MCL1040001.1 hypothetical protein [Shewanella submarina]